MSQNNMESRTATKTGEGHLLRKLEQEFHFPPRIAQAVVEEAKASLEGSEPVEAGQVRRYLSRGEFLIAAAVSATVRSFAASAAGHRVANGRRHRWR